MKELPEIAPEVRSLVESIVANPRSQIRLVPRRALLPWISQDATASADSFSRGTAERHLVMAYRDAIARLLREASYIAFWKAPTLSHKPTGADGWQFNPAAGEENWSARAARRVQAASHADEGVALLSQCLGCIDPASGLDLARASLSFAPSAEARLAVAEHLKQDQPRSSLRVFERLSVEARTPLVRAFAWAGRGHRLCHLLDFDGAVAAYEVSSNTWPSAWFCRFNLACVRERREEAVEAATAIADRWSAESTQVEEARDLFAGWARGLPSKPRSAARRTLDHLADVLPDAARRVGEAYD